MGTPAGTTAPATRGRRVAQVLREPALPLLLAASVAMVVREYLPDILLFLGTSLLLLLDAVRWDEGSRSAPPSPQPARSAGPVRWLAVALLPVSGLVALLPRTSVRLDLVLSAVGLVALWWCWSPGEGRRRTPPAPASAPSAEEAADRPPPHWQAWPAFAVSVALVELWSFVHQTSPRVDSPAHPTLSTVTEPALASASARAVVLWLWLLAGVWLLRRVRAWTSAGTGAGTA